MGIESGRGKHKIYDRPQGVEGVQGLSIAKADRTRLSGGL